MVFKTYFCLSNSTRVATTRRADADGRRVRGGGPIVYSHDRGGPIVYSHDHNHAP